MGAARKLREQEKPTQLRPLRTMEKDINIPIKSFITLLFVLSTLAVGISIFFSHTNDENLEEFIEDVLNDQSNEYKKFTLRKLTKEESEKLTAISEIDLTGYSWKLDDSFIKHTLKNHGNERQQRKQRQVAVQPKDFLIVSEIINIPDHIRISPNKSGTGCKMIHLEKKLDNHYHLLVEIRTGKKELMTKTMYIKKDIK
jgi:hypothetical protein